jgi:exopolysaccharide/PEP-CTERM locus tyrosine autokinase
MSLVERALKKLQESKSSTAVAPIMVAGQVMRPGVRAATDTSQVPSKLAPFSPTPVDPSRRAVSIDRNALRAMHLLPPPPFERQVAGQYQHIKRPLVASALGKSDPRIPNGHLIMLASALPGEGKTFTSINLALSLALEKDIEVLLVDADVAKPHVTRLFGLQSERGLLDLLVDRSLHAESLILPTDVPGLSLLPAGRQIDTATELLASEHMQQVAKQLGGSHGRRVVLFDSPPLLLSTESRAMLGAIGQVVLVVRAEVTAQQAVNDAIEAVGEKPTTLILNQSNSGFAPGYYGYGTYGDAAATGDQG